MSSGSACLLGFAGYCNPPRSVIFPTSPCQPMWSSRGVRPRSRGGGRRGICFWSDDSPIGNSFRLQRRNFRALRSQTAIAPFALLVVCQRGIEFRTPEIGPKRLGDVNFRVGDLPQQEIADAHLAAGADDQIGIGQGVGVEILSDSLLVHAT